MRTLLTRLWFRRAAVSLRSSVAAQPADGMAWLNQLVAQALDVRYSQSPSEKSCLMLPLETRNFLVPSRSRTPAAGKGSAA